MLATLLNISLIILAVSILATLYRVLKGPSIPDRIIALDMIGINIIGIVAVLSIKLQTQVFLEIILLIGIIAFIGTIAFSRYLEKGGAILESKRDS